MAKTQASWQFRVIGLLLSGFSMVLGAAPAARGMPHPLAVLAPPPEGASASRLGQFSLVHSYDLGPALLTQTGVPSRWETMPFTLNGTLAIPPGSGPFPIVLLLHGRHPGCHFQDTRAPSPWPCPAGAETRFDQGLAYLAQALAESGYLAVAPNLNGAYANAYGATSDNRNDVTDARLQQIIAAHWQALTAATAGESDSFPVSLRGEIDLSRVALIGHSRGGGAAVSMVGQQSRLFSQAEPGAVRALLLVSPTPSRAIATHPAAYQLPDIPTSIVVGGCDRDIYDLSSLFYFETANRDFTRQTPVVALLLPGANHNFFNPSIAEDDYYRQPDHPALCNPQQSALRLSRVDQEDFLVQYARDFLAHTLGNPRQSDRSKLLHALAPERSDTLYGFPVVSNVTPPSDHRYGFFNPTPTKNSPAVPYASGEVLYSFCPDLQPCPHALPRRPAFPSVLHISWQESGGHLQFRLPAALDLNHFEYLQIRLASPPTPSGAAAGDGFAVVMRDQAEQAVRVEIPGTTGALGTVPFSPSPDGAPALAYPSTLTIPLLQFRGLDFQRLTAIDFIFDPGTTGTLMLAGIELVNQPAADIPVTRPWPNVPAAAASEFWPVHREGIGNVQQ